MTGATAYRERAARNVAIAIVFWATARTTLALAVLLSGLIASAQDPEVASLVERYSTVRGQIRSPAIGYVGPPGSAESVVRRQMLARYTLAPVLVDKHDSHALVLVDLDSDAALADYVARTGAQVRIHSRPGLAIVERSELAPMIWTATFGVAVASSSGYLALAWLIPAPAGWPLRIVRACLSVVIGVALHSVWQLPWVALSAQGGGWTSFLFFDLALPCLLLASLAWSRGRWSPARQKEAPVERTGWLLPTAAIGVGIGVVLAWTVARLQPDGAWDAWAIWNFKARWLALGGSPWSAILTNAGLDTAHPDYPLLLPLSVSRLWLITGGTPPSVPEAVGVCAAALATALVVSGTWWLRGARSAAVAGAGILMLPGFLRASASQMADVPLACCYVAAVVAMALGTQSGSTRWFTVAGLSAGAAMWTKNEGVLFTVTAVIGLLGMTAVASGGRREPLRNLGAFAAGLTPFLVATAALRTIAIPTDLIVDQSLLVTWGRLTTLARHEAIFRHGLSLMRSMPDVIGVVALAAYLGLTGLARDLRAGLLVAGTLGLTACGYYAAYVVTPYDLAWHLDTSADRLVVQLWPSTVFAALLLTREAWNRETPTT